MAERDNAVSPHCHVAFINADERTAPMSKVFAEGEDSFPLGIPMLLYGVDVMGMTQRSAEAIQSLVRGEDPRDDWGDAFDNDLRRRP